VVQGAILYLISQLLSWKPAYGQFNSVHLWVVFADSCRCNFLHNTEGADNRSVMTATILLIGRVSRKHTSVFQSHNTSHNAVAALRRVVVVVVVVVWTVHMLLWC